MIKPKELGWAGHVTCMTEMRFYTTFRTKNTINMAGGCDLNSFAHGCEPVATHFIHRNEPSVSKICVEFLYYARISDCKDEL
jgi:hypothetical protein